VQDLKVNLENSTYLKSQLAGQLEDARRRLEDDERVSKAILPHNSMQKGYENIKSNYSKSVSHEKNILLSLQFFFYKMC
jgi:hypothetical protein